MRRIAFSRSFLGLASLGGARRSRPGTPLAVEWMKTLTTEKKKRGFKKIRVEDYVLEREKKNIRNLH
jgi:hypothetical protein